MKVKTAVLTSVLCNVLSASTINGVSSDTMIKFAEQQEAEIKAFQANEPLKGIYRNHQVTFRAEIPIKTITKTVVVQSPPTITTPPPNIGNPDPNSKYYQIKDIEFSGTFGTFRKYTYKKHKYEDFPMGHTNGIKFRVRDWTTRYDDSSYKVSWANGSFTGGSQTYSPGGFRMYGKNGWLRLQYKNGAYAQFKINKRAVNGKYIQLYDSKQGVIVSHDANNRRFCFSSSLGTGCVSYNIAYEAIP